MNNAQPPSPRVVVHLVHGTFPRGALSLAARNLCAAWSVLRRRPFNEEDGVAPPPKSADKRCWFEEGSPFEEALKSHLGDDAHAVAFNRLLWSGNNSFSARREGARLLKAHLINAHSTYPQARHLIVAHSHGGTVAVNAVDRGDPRLPALAAGIMTLGTPFVRLATRVPLESKNTLLVGLGILMRGSAFILPTLLSAAAAWNSKGWGWALSGMCVLAAAGLLVRNPVLGLLGVLGGLLAGASVTLGQFGVAVLIAFGVMFVLANQMSSSPAMTVLRYIQDEPIQLPCPLIAVRTVNDEAGFVIGLAQTTERFVSLLIGAVLKGANFFLLLCKGPLPFYLSSLALTSALLWVYAQMTAKTISLWVYVAGPVFFLGAGLAVVAAVIPCVWLAVSFLLSLATGHEALAAPLAGADAEPLPFAEPENAMRLVIDVKGGKEMGWHAVNHSLHQLTSVRLRIANWIQAALAEAS